MINIESNFKKLCLQYSSDNALINKLWQELYLAYGSKDRYYHNLEHLQDLYWQLNGFLDSVYEFAIFYHDAIYDVTKDNNEEQSAKLALNRLQSLKVPFGLVKKVESIILDTKSHTPTMQESAMLLDADLAILGASRDKYIKYLQNIQKEYASFNKEQFIEGRVSVIEHFLAKKQIYTTTHFYQKLEFKARENLEYELKGYINGRNFKY